tara:strand:+ start:108 stop:1055 length:948 start_codon:yes stop_codon:yes gene_type:complete
MVQTSMMNKDIETQIHFCEGEIQKLKVNIQNHETILSAYDFDAPLFFSNYISLLERAKTAKNKERKQLGRSLRQIEENESNKLKQKHVYDEMVQWKQELTQMEQNKSFAENYIKDQIQGLYSILKDHAYVDEEMKPTQKALNACYIHELPCLVFCDFYTQFNRLEHYSEIELVCLLSCFYDLKVKEDYKTHCPPILKEEMNYIQDKIHAYTDRELLHNMYITCQYKLQYDLMDYVKIWYEDIDDEQKSVLFFERLKQEKDVFIGDFMKCCMKLLNMCNELKIFAENDSHYAFLEKINTIQRNIEKNIVTNQSFYL